ncbi:DMSO/selenate family reductase complex B subunit [Clostridium sp. YIM B02555]|uniref:DMSO/selenate family reductase complex B subunit n=1 Tax=Clostridium sp. YIM B02555 TaxID=2911968 RepID=UPI001EED034C|nr:DMSO/selenate family reductase complex B subunit [Clostridium sp. YIM B02555]
MPKQLAFYFEQKYCTGCYTCQIACKDKNNLEVGEQFRKVYEVTGGNYIKRGNLIIQDIYAFWISVSCNHCIDPICVKKCPTGALKKRLEDGIVILDRNKCVGCTSCVKSCPYEAIQYDSNIRKVSKCDFCLDLIESGKDPVCISSCPMRALDYGELEVLQQKYGNINETDGLPSSKITKPALVITPHKNAIKPQGGIGNNG